MSRPASAEQLRHRARVHAQAIAAASDVPRGLAGQCCAEKDALIAELLRAVRISRGNVASLGPAGALGPVYAPYEQWLAMLDAAIAKATVQ